MILYLDASALVKRYIAERGSVQVNSWIGGAELVVTSILSRIEVAAAIARARQLNMFVPDEAAAALGRFRSEWESLTRLPGTENVIVRGDLLAIEHNLRGYNAMYLACALTWQETLGIKVTLATFDRRLWEAAREIKMEYLPKG